MNKLEGLLILSDIENIENYKDSKVIIIFKIDLSNTL